MKQPRRFFVGLETGGTKLVGSVLDDALRPLATTEIARPAKATARETFNLLVTLADDVQRQAGLSARTPTAIGWGFGGLVDRVANRPGQNFHEAGWEEFDAGAALAKACRAPVYIENDCKIAALAEAHLGAGSTEGLTAYITLGSGVGGGLIWNGQILASGRFGEGEIGHTCVVAKGARCACGRRGCLEAYCSGWGVGERAVEAIAATNKSTPLMREILAAEPRRRAAILFSAWPKDRFARQQVSEFLEHLADGCAMLTLLVAPSRLVLGGGIAQQPWLAAELTPKLEQRLLPAMRGQSHVCIARLGTACVSLGAALYARLRSQRGAGDRQKTPRGKARSA